MSMLIDDEPAEIDPRELESNAAMRRDASRPAAIPHPRAERYSPVPGEQLQVYDASRVPRLLGTVEDISRSGLALAWASPARSLPPGTSLDRVVLRAETDWFPCGPARVVRDFVTVTRSGREPRHAAGVAFDVEQPALIDLLSSRLRRARYVSGDLEPDAARERPRRSNASDHTIDKFASRASPDLFAKCDDFRAWIEDMQARGLYQRLFRVTVTGALDSRITIFDPVARCERPMLCFDSNSYLSLHRHPRVLERVERVMRQVGFGTPSAQLLGGTSRHLRELEIELSAFHGREDALVFPTGFAANLGAVAALVRQDDAVLRDRFAHASIHEACRSSPARSNRVFAHNDMESLERVLQKTDEAGCQGKLIVTDGVFSMHGRLAPLPELVALARRYGARLMIDDAHGVGVIGASGGGIEEHYGMPGSVDVLMGTLSKSFGSLGGYVTGSRDLLYYLRFFAPSSMFSTSLPAPLCAGLAEAIRIVREEPEHHARLWRNIRQFVPALAAAGFVVAEPQSAIVPIFIGADAVMFQLNRALFDAGIKCSSVAYPAVAKDEAILRLTLNASHTESDLAQAVEVLTRLGRSLGLLHLTREELCERAARQTSVEAGS